jgi:threonine/homoserine/homoserine lactone efflux protein
MDILISFVLAVSFLAISPGPDNIFVLMQSVVHGKKYGISTIAGLMSGCLVHTTFVAFGVSTIIKENNTIFLVIKLLGAIYLFFLSCRVFKSDDTITMTTQNIQKKTPFQLFKMGFMMNVLNPKVTIFFLALFPGFLFSNELSTVVQFYVLGGVFILVSFVIFSTIALLGGSISERIQQNKQIEVWLKWMQIIVFIGIALFILI